MKYVILEKARVKGFIRTRRGKLERVSSFERDQRNRGKLRRTDAVSKLIDFDKKKYPKVDSKTGKEIKGMTRKELKNFTKKELLDEGGYTLREFETMSNAELRHYANEINSGSMYGFYKEDFKEEVVSPGRSEIEAGFQHYKDDLSTGGLMQALSKNPKAAEELRLQTIKDLKERRVKYLYRLGGEKGAKGVVSYTADLQRLKESLEIDPNVEDTSLGNWRERSVLKLKITPEVEKRIILSEMVVEELTTDVDEAEVLLRKGGING